MLAYQRGDQAAFELLYRRHKDDLYGFIYRNCSNTASVEEIAHDVWIAVIDAADRYQVKAKFKTYLFSIAHNKLVDYWRKFNHDGVYDESSEEGEYQISVDADPGSALYTEQLLTLVQQLPLEQSQALLLLEQGFSHQEIVEITQAAPETVKRQNSLC